MKNYRYYKKKLKKLLKNILNDVNNSVYYDGNTSNGLKSGIAYSQYIIILISEEDVRCYIKGRFMNKLYYEHIRLY